MSTEPNYCRDGFDGEAPELCPHCGKLPQPPRRTLVAELCGRFADAIEYKGYLLVPLAGSGYSVQRRSSATRDPFHVAYAATLDRARRLVDELA